MAEHIDPAEFHRRAEEVRKIAAGLFDHDQRDLVLRFVDDCEERIVPPAGRTPMQPAS